MARKLKDCCGIVYLFSNDLLAKEGWYKYGITINPIERKMVQSNSTPPDHPFEDEIIIFSTHYKEIERQLGAEFEKREWKHSGKGKNAGNEWIQHNNLEDIVEIYKEMLKKFSGAEMCYNGARYIYENGKIVKKKLPNCRLDFLGIRDGDNIQFEKDGKSLVFEVKDNGILVDGEPVTLSNYVEKQLSKPSNTNKFNGYRYFKYKNKILYNEWQSLVNCGNKNK